jgi:hypothetical protein
MKEQATGVVEIKDIDAETIEALIEYVYKESVDNLSEVAFELLKVADKYEIEGLKVG